MEYKGKLYGKVGKSYFPLLHTSDDYDNLVKRVAELEALIEQNSHKHSVSGKRPDDFEISDTMYKVGTAWLRPEKAACASSAVDTVAEARDFRHCYIRKNIGCACTNECGYDAVNERRSSEGQP